MDEIVIFKMTENWVINPFGSAWQTFNKKEQKIETNRKKNNVEIKMFINWKRILKAWSLLVSGVSKLFLINDERVFDWTIIFSKYLALSFTNSIKIFSCKQFFKISK